MKRKAQRQSSEHARLPLATVKRSSALKSEGIGHTELTLYTNGEERRMNHWAGWFAALVVAIGIAGLVVVRTARHDAATWHVNPADAAPAAKSNATLAAPIGATRSEPDIVLDSRARSPADLLAALDAVARSEPRVEVVAGDIATRKITYVQRSAVIGFPDYISVSAVETPAGSSLIVWSRSRYGYSDLGVNRARLERWLKAAGLL